MHDNIKRKNGHWESFGDIDGLTHSCACLMEDGNRNLWIGHRGGGISLYDGKKFVNFTKNDGLAGDNVRCIFQDDDANIWIATWWYGISKFDGKKFENFIVNDGLADNITNSIIQDKKGNIWIATENGISIYEYDNKKFVNLTVKDGLVGNNIRCLYEDREGNIWIGGWDNKGLSKYEYDSQKFINLTVEDGLSNNNVNCITEDRKGDIWIGTENGLSRYDGKEFENFTVKDGLLSHNINCIYEDKKGHIWLGFGIQPIGASCYDVEAEEFLNFSVEDGLSNNTVIDIIGDKEENLWFACWQGGISRYEPDSVIEISEESVNQTMIRDSRGHLWWGNGNILSEYDGDAGEVYHRYSFRNPIVGLLQDRKERLWVGVKGEGVYRYDDIKHLEGQEPKRFTTDVGLVDNNITGICEDAKENIWIGTNDGVSRYDGSKFVNYTADSLGIVEVKCISEICQDAEGAIWFGSWWGGGISRYKKGEFRRYTTKNGLANDKVLCMMEDDKNTLWIGTYSGISCYDGKSFRNYTKDDGLLGSAISCIYQDRRGQMWIGTLGGGVSRFDGRNFQILTAENGLPGNSITGIVEDRKEEDDESIENIIISTHKGTIRYTPDYKTPPLIRIDEVDADRIYEQPENIQISENSSSIRIRYHGVSFKTKRMRYSYTLEGYDKEWKSTWNEEVRYENLPVGEYTFKVIAINRDLVYSQEPDELKIEIIADLRSQIINDLEKRVREVGYLAYHDALTDLPNRRLFEDRLSLELAHAKRSKQILGVMFLDMDRFKQINDTLGHNVGDQFIKFISERLADLIREGDTVARLGGDEFTLLLPGLNHIEDIAKVAQRIIDSFKQPWIWEGKEFQVTASIGIAIYPNDGESPETLMKNADIAMYRAKEEGKNQYKFYNPVMSAKILERLDMENSLRHALERQELMVFYQPRVNIKTKKIVSMESLICWRHPDRGLLYANDFIFLAEDSGLILPIGEWILRTACAQNKVWQKRGLLPIMVSVNLSARQFKRTNLVEVIDSTLKETGLEARWLELEITESAIIKNVEYTVDMLLNLKKMGVQILIDDFGVGYSSLSYLKRFPINAIKIDRSFVQNVAKDPNDAAIITAIINLARTLKLKVIAEGVETKRQFEFLKKRGCVEMQGYIFSKPVSPEEAEKLIEGKSFEP